MTDRPRPRRRKHQQWQRPIEPLRPPRMRPLRCTCGDPDRPGVTHRMDVPCYEEDQ